MGKTSWTTVILPPYSSSIILGYLIYRKTFTDSRKMSLSVSIMFKSSLVRNYNIYSNCTSNGSFSARISLISSACLHPSAWYAACDSLSIYTDDPVLPSSYEMTLTYIREARSVMRLPPRYHCQTLALIFRLKSAHQKSLPLTAVNS